MFPDIVESVDLASLRHQYIATRYVTYSVMTLGDEGASPYRSWTYVDQPSARCHNISEANEAQGQSLRRLLISLFPRPFISEMPHGDQSKRAHSAFLFSVHQSLLRNVWAHELRLFTDWTSPAGRDASFDSSALGMNNHFVRPPDREVRRLVATSISLPLYRHSLVTLFMIFASSLLIESIV